MLMLAAALAQRATRANDDVLNRASVALMDARDKMLVDEAELVTLRIAKTRLENEIAVLKKSLLESEDRNFTLAAGQCIVPNGLTSDEGGTQHCSLLLQDECRGLSKAPTKTAEALLREAVDLMFGNSEWRERVRAALAEKAELAWRPIESAPKDDGSVLIADAVAGAVGESQWIGDSWWTVDGDRWVSPTHWQPLPAPPAAQADEGDSNV
jgi:hypothetical protein